MIIRVKLRPFDEWTLLWNIEKWRSWLRYLIQGDHAFVGMFFLDMGRCQRCGGQEVKTRGRILEYVPGMGFLMQPYLLTKMIPDGQETIFTLHQMNDFPLYGHEWMMLADQERLEGSHRRNCRPWGSTMTMNPFAAVLLVIGSAIAVILTFYFFMRAKHDRE
jgi:hypothetical protein